MGGSTERLYQKTAGKGSRSAEARLGETLFSWCYGRREAGRGAQNQGESSRIQRPKEAGLIQAGVQSTDFSSAAGKRYAAKKAARNRMRPKRNDVRLGGLEDSRARHQTRESAAAQRLHGPRRYS